MADERTLPIGLAAIDQPRPVAETQRMFETVINRDRHPEIFAYDDDTEILRLDIF
jgi:hypothetical protein